VVGTTLCLLIALANAAPQIGGFGGIGLAGHGHGHVGYAGHGADYYVS